MADREGSHGPFALNDLYTLTGYSGALIANGNFQRRPPLQGLVYKGPVRQPAQPPYKSPPILFVVNHLPSFPRRSSSNSARRAFCRGDPKADELFKG